MISVKIKEEPDYKIGDEVLAKTKEMQGKHQLWVLYATTEGNLWKNAGGYSVMFSALIDIKEPYTFRNPDGTINEGWK